MNFNTGQPDIPSVPFHGAWVIPEFLIGASCVAVALLSTAGEMLHANRGFLNLAGDGETVRPGSDLRQIFIDPSFDQLLARRPAVTDGRVFDGELTLGWPGQPGICFNALMLRFADRLLLYAEHDIASLTRLNSIFMKLNDGLTELHRASQRRNRQLLRQESKIEALVVTDQLTGVANRRGLDQRIKHEIERARRVHRPLGILMADIDNFKNVNDSFGHGVGDLVLKQIAEILLGCARAIDYVARYGGEEFVMLLPESNLDNARVIAERIRLQVAAHVFDGITHPVTISIGVAQWCENINEEEAELFKRVDTALYQSKHQGRNRVTLAR